MIKIDNQPYIYCNENKLIPAKIFFERVESAECLRRYKKLTISAQIFTTHNTSVSGEQLRLKFDALASHDITYVGIIQTARASGMNCFPLPYVLTNCHNSLCAVGGTINEDDHAFGLSAAKKYGGIYVPAHQAVIHQYVREMQCVCGEMILGSDSHTRYGPLGAMGFGEGGGELVKQLLENTYNIAMPEVIMVYLEGAPQNGVGPHDVALALIGAVFKSGFVKNRILEFVGPGIRNLSVDFRNGIDVMTTETTCLSSIWTTDEIVERYYRLHGRAEAYRCLNPKENACYDGLIRMDLSTIEPMIALPFHPSNIYSLREFCAEPRDILAKIDAEHGTNLVSKVHDGAVWVDQGVIAGCAGGTFENICTTADILGDGSIGSDKFSLSVYPSSVPVNSALLQNGKILSLLRTGAILKTAFCGPCFGAGDVPENQGFSIRHTTRNFPNREGSKPDQGQIAAVALMDARSIAATAAQCGRLTSATDLRHESKTPEYVFDAQIYQKRVYYGFGKPQSETLLQFGPNITDWPKIAPIQKDLILVVAAVIDDPVTTTDELIPSGETSAYRSNPLKLAEFTLSRRIPKYTTCAKRIRDLGISGVLPSVKEKSGVLDWSTVTIGSVICAKKIGDGSAREQAASCQKMLGGCANIAVEYATKRYRSNLINWGIVPFTLADGQTFNLKDEAVLILTDFIPKIKSGEKSFIAKVFDNGKWGEIRLECIGLSDEERRILTDGCLINYYENMQRGTKNG